MERWGIEYYDKNLLGWFRYLNNSTWGTKEGAQAEVDCINRNKNKFDSRPERVKYRVVSVKIK